MAVMGFDFWKLQSVKTDAVPVCTAVCSSQSPVVTRCCTQWLPGGANCARSPLQPPWHRSSRAVPCPEEESGMLQPGAGGLQPGVLGVTALSPSCNPQDVCATQLSRKALLAPMMFTCCCCQLSFFSFCLEKCKQINGHFCLV